RDGLDWLAGLGHVVCVGSRTILLIRRPDRFQQVSTVWIRIATCVGVIFILPDAIGNALADLIRSGSNHLLQVAFAVIVIIEGETARSFDIDYSPGFANVRLQESLA